MQLKLHWPTMRWKFSYFLYVYFECHCLVLFDDIVHAPTCLGPVVTGQNYLPASNVLIYNLFPPVFKLFGSLHLWLWSMVTLWYLGTFRSWIEYIAQLTEFLFISSRHGQSAPHSYILFSCFLRGASYFHKGLICQNGEIELYTSN